MKSFRHKEGCKLSGHNDHDNPISKIRTILQKFIQNAYIITTECGRWDLLKTKGLKLWI
jgi:Rps23 Pro-64 3,4-dihydroxylase Tpa1-like proline 4-hydroxylase